MLILMSKKFLMRIKIEEIKYMNYQIIPPEDVI